MAPRNVALAMHAHYRCQHTGRCCTAGWRIPIEHEPAARIREALGRGTLQPPAGSGGVDPLPGRRGLPAEYAGELAHRPDGSCVFFNDDGRRLCEVHRLLGEAALGQACRQFPRMASHDARGTEISLSHFCPTAARLLLEGDAATLIDVTTAMPAATRLEGLDAHDALPPLLRPAVLFSFDGWTRWQHFAVDAFAGCRTAAAALDLLAETAERLHRWDTSCGEFDPYLDGVLDAAGRGPEKGVGDGHLPPPRCLEARATWARAAGAVPPVFSPPDEPDWSRWGAATSAWAQHERVMCRYLAGRSVGAWVAYQGRGLRSWVRWLALAWHVALAEGCRAPEPDSATGSPVLDAIRRTDLLLVHLVDPQCMADVLSALEPRALGAHLLPFDDDQGMGFNDQRDSCSSDPG